MSFLPIAEVSGGVSGEDPEFHGDFSGNNQWGSHLLRSGTSATFLLKFLRELTVQ